MNRTPAAAILALAVAAAGCSLRDSCAAPRGFPRFNNAPMHDAKMVPAETLPPAVEEAVTRFLFAEEYDHSRFASSEEALAHHRATSSYVRHYPIILARDEGRYLLLAVRNHAAFDANWFLVYSKQLDCIVGRFAWHTQG